MGVLMSGGLSRRRVRGGGTSLFLCSFFSWSCGCVKGEVFFFLEIKEIFYMISEGLACFREVCRLFLIELGDNQISWRSAGMAAMSESEGSGRRSSMSMSMAARRSMYT